MATEDGRNKRDGAAVGPRWLVAKGKRGKGFLLRCFNQAGFAAASRGSNFHFSEPHPNKPCTNVSVYFPPSLSLPIWSPLSRSAARDLYICVCSALKHYPRFTCDPIRLLKKLRDWKKVALCGNETHVLRWRQGCRGAKKKKKKFITFSRFNNVLFNLHLPFRVTTP